MYSVHYNDWICRDNLDTIQAVLNVAALYFGSIPLMDADSKPIDMIYLCSQKNLLRSSALEVYAN